MRRRPIGTIIVLLVLVGCGSDRSDVSGTLSSTDGQPIVKARITARDQETGHWATAVSDEQGQYRLGVEKQGDGIPPGNYNVVIVEDRGDWDNPQPPQIDAKYAEPTTSGLSLSVQAGEKRTFDVSLEPPLGNRK